MPGPSIAELDILWITAGLSCDGDTVSITAATQPSIEDILLGVIPGIPQVSGQGLTEARGIDGRDALWAHPDLLPTADDLENPDAFVRGQPEFDISDLENPEDSSPKSQDEGD